VRLVVSRKSLKWILRWTQRVLFAGGVSMLAYCAFVLADAWMFQKKEHRQLDRLRSERQAANSEAPSIAAPASSRLSPPAVIDGLVGRIAIPRLGLSAIVMEGTGTITLRRAVGHISGTGLPGRPGNVGLAAHRDTFFRPLRNIRQNDIITLTTLLGVYRYRVVSITIVNPRDVEVLNPSKNEVLTLVTCYPFYFVGAAPDRFIVRAVRVT
jgi:sortase A